MSKGFYQVPVAVNEPVKSYAPGSKERELTLNSFKEQYNQQVDIPLYINGEEIRTGDTKDLFPPFDHKHKLGVYHQADQSLVEKAVSTALQAKVKWAAMPWEQRASIFLKAADLLAGPYRAKINAATMIAQAKTLHQAEIDAACEFIDFLRFNAQYMAQIYSEQPESSEGMWNRLEHRPLEGFIYAITPFNFTAIAGNLPTSVAMMGNVVVWKPSATQIYSARVIVEVLQKAGLPKGVINVIYGNSGMITDTLLASPDFAGIHFTGSTGVFNSMWNKIGQNINNYKTYPRIVGETGGKDFVIAHPSACPKEVAVALVRGAFEYQGQKCSAASRAYIPASLWEQVKQYVGQDLATIKMGSPEDPSNFVSSVISESSFDKLASAIDQAQKDTDAQVIFGGKYDKSVGYFIEPTIIETTNAHYTTMETELFGPVLTVYVYEDEKWSETLKLVDQTSIYALTGAILATCRYAIVEATEALQNCAGNFYINDKPTGAVVGQQPFGGARASGTNDKAGSILNLLRWVSPRTIKETFVPATDYKYPFLG
ncbi:L-glutamate gamma-semialdehyde dehydrogenase [Myroides sp. LJL119]